MKIIIESTTELVDLERNGTTFKARLWEGETDTGIKVQCLITRIAARKSEDIAEFDRELIEQRAPSTTERAFPLRMIL